jgi:hypothetical protein
MTDMMAIAAKMRGDTPVGIMSNCEAFTDEILIRRFGDVEGVFEMHHFFDIIGTDEKPISKEFLDYFDKVCDTINEHFGVLFAPKKMKSPHLALNFNMKEMHDTKGLYDPSDPNFNKYISILQPSLYLLDTSYKDAVYITHEFSKLFCEFGFNVIREKLESCVRGTTGIPTSRDEAYMNARDYKKYYEFHISIKKNNSDKMNDDDIKNLNSLIADMQRELNGLRIAFSYNKHHEGQMFINVRIRTLPSDECLELMGHISQRIKKSGEFYVNKIIEEYILYDTFSSLDAGWIDSDKIDLEDTKKVEDSVYVSIAIQKRSYRF